MNRFTFYLLFVILIGCEQRNSETHLIQDPVFEEFHFESSIRAIELGNDGSCWFSGSNGLVGRTFDNGKTWHTDTLIHNGTKPEFRSLAITDSAVFVLSVGSPALLYRTKDQGKTWELVYTEDHPDCFYNSMKFLDDHHGIAVGDPIENHLSILITKTGGATWLKIPGRMLPETETGEAGFAASNSCIAFSGNYIWIVTGGQRARVLRSPNRGQSWEFLNTPIQEGEQMTGIFSVDFYNESTGIIWGGNWNEMTDNQNCKAITHDGGVSWKVLNAEGSPGYRSCVQFLPGSKGEAIIAAGIPGLTYSRNGGKSWDILSDSSYYAIRVSKKENVAWLSGKNKVARMSW